MFKLLLLAVLPFAQLGSPKFAAREHASTVIIESDNLAAVQAKMAEGNSDFEVSMRLANIELRIRERRLRVEKDKIRKGQVSKYPGWKEWSDIAGHSELSKELFYEAIETHRNIIFEFLKDDGYRHGKGLAFLSKNDYQWDSGIFVVSTIMYGKTKRGFYKKSMSKIVRNYGQWYDACTFGCTLCEEHYYAEDDYKFIRNIVTNLDGRKNDEDSAK